jgi:hypothetical protein
MPAAHNVTSSPANPKKATVLKGSSFLPRTGEQLSPYACHTASHLVATDLYQSATRFEVDKATAATMQSGFTGLRGNAIDRVAACVKLASAQFAG